MKKIKKILIVLVSFFIILNIIAQLILSLSGLGLTVFDIYAQQLPKNDNIENKHKDQYVITKSSYFENQGLNQCAGFSTAYVLRTYNIAVTGNSIYKSLNYKFANGYVLPQAITNKLRDEGFKVTLYKGNIDQLKTRLDEDKPIIVLIGEDIKWLHYVTVVGYNQNDIYLYDSLKSNTNNKKYNRIMSNEEFSKYWNTGIPIYNNIYYVISK